MSISDVLWGEKETILAALHIGIVNGLVNTWDVCRSLGNHPQEPDLVAGLVLESTPIMYTILNQVLSRSRIAISVSAVYCHQKPEITYDVAVKSCELGDVLFVYVHRPRQGSCRRNALLFQAKMSAKQPYPISPSELHQLRLYTDWPDFSYIRSSFLTGSLRSVSPKSPHAGAQYLLIDDRHPSNPASGLLGLPGTYPVGCCMPNERLYDHADLASELFELLIFKTGRPFEDRKAAQTGNGWSRVVWDLIEAGLMKSFNRKNSGQYATPRISGNPILADGLSFCAASSNRSISTASEILGPHRASLLFDSGGDEPPLNNQREPDEREPQAGVSVILIETLELNNEE